MDAALAFCHGTPLRNEIEARAAAGLDTATKTAAEAIAERFGRGAVDGKIQANIVSVTTGTRDAVSSFQRQSAVTHAGRERSDRSRKREDARRVAA